MTPDSGRPAAPAALGTPEDVGRCFAALARGDLALFHRSVIMVGRRYGSSQALGLRRASSGIGPYRCTRPDASPPISLVTSDSVTRLKSPGTE